MNIKFRKANMDDIETMIQIQSKSFFDDYKKYGECPSYNESPKSISKSIHEGIVYIIENEEKAIGDIVIHKRNGKHYHLQVICVLPEYHNNGIGQLGLKYIEEENQAVNCWSLITPFESFRNHYLYEKMGYKKVGEYRHSDILTMFQFEKRKE